MTWSYLVWNVKASLCFVLLPRNSYNLPDASVFAMHLVNRCDNPERKHRNGNARRSACLLALRIMQWKVGFFPETGAENFNRIQNALVHKTLSLHQLLKMFGLFFQIQDSSQHKRVNSHIGVLEKETHEDDWKKRIFWWPVVERHPLWFILYLYLSQDWRDFSTQKSGWPQFWVNM